MLTTSLVGKIKSPLSLTDFPNKFLVVLLRRYSNYRHLVKPLVNLLKEVSSATDDHNKTVTVDQETDQFAQDQDPEACDTVRNQATTVCQKQHRLTQEETARLVSRYQAGAHIKELAVEFDLDRRTVSAILRREGVQLRPRGLTNEQIDQAVQLYSQGWSLVRIEEKFKVDAETVRTQLRKRGVRMRKAWER